MAIASCLIQLAAMVVTFNGNSLVNISSPSLFNGITSMVVQFKTTQLHSQIVATKSQNQSFALNIRNGILKLQYNFNETGNGSFDIGLVNTNKWFLLNITSKDSLTHIYLSENDNSVTTCAPKFTTVKNITLFGKEFSNLLETSGLKIGGPIDYAGLKSFEGCIGLFSLNNQVIDLLNMSKNSQPFKRKIMGTSKGCHCGRNSCVKGVYIWDETKGKCDCKCSLGYQGEFCNQTMTEVSEEDDVDSEFIYVVVGVAVGVLLLVTLVICAVVYIKRTNSSVFGVYNPKSQEQVQGQQMNTAFTLPIPEKLI